MLFGRAFHAYLLQPELFKKGYIVFDPANRPEQDKGMTSKINKEWREKFNESGKDILTAEQLIQIQDMKRSIMDNFYARALLSNGSPETSFFTELNGVKVKARADYWRVKKNKNIIVEVKTTTDARPDIFARDMAKYNYHISVAYYVDIVQQITGNECDYLFIVVEKDAPHGMSILRPSDQVHSCGCYEYEVLLELYNQCNQSNQFPGYGVWTDNKYDVQEIDLPGYAIKEINHKEIK